MKKSILFCISLIISLSNVKAQTIQDAKKLTESEQYDAAGEIYNSLLKTNPSDISLYYFLGDNLLKNDNSDSAKIIFDKGKALDQTNPLIKIGYAKLLLDEIDQREAKASSDKDPNNMELKTRLNKAEINIKQANTLIDEAILNSKKSPILIEAAEAFVHYKNKNTD